MLRERSLGESLWEAVLPPELRELPAELAKVDEERFLVPFRSRLRAKSGRPTIAIETYLRLMYLKYRYQLGYETLCKEVADSFAWRRFCRIALDGRVPDPSTLMKLTKRLGPGLLEELNDELLGLAVEREAAALAPAACRHDRGRVGYPLPDRLRSVRPCSLAADATHTVCAAAGAGRADAAA
jgi:IS5 family transposase